MCFAWLVRPIGHRCAECGELFAADAIDSRILATEAQRRSKPLDPPLRRITARPRVAGRRSKHRGQSDDAGASHQTPDAPDGSQAPPVPPSASRRRRRRLSPNA